MSRTVLIDPVTRIEGHAKITLHLLSEIKQKLIQIQKRHVAARATGQPNGGKAQT
jgi:coenzyme F420-reducing hydrogenase alpha subunit